MFRIRGAIEEQAPGRWPNSKQNPTLSTTESGEGRTTDGFQNKLRAGSETNLAEQLRKFIQISAPRANEINSATQRWAHVY